MGGIQKVDNEINEIKMREININKIQNTSNKNKCERIKINRIYHNNLLFAKIKPTVSG